MRIRKGWGDVRLGNVVESAMNMKLRGIIAYCDLLS